MSTNPRTEAAANLIADRDYPYYTPDLEFATKVVAAADKAATIGGATSRNETAAVIEGLPDGTVVADTTDDVFQLRGGLWCSYESVPLTGFQLAKYAPITILRHGGAE